MNRSGRLELPAFELQISEGGMRNGSSLSSTRVCCVDTTSLAWELPPIELSAANGVLLTKLPWITNVSCEDSDVVLIITCQYVASNYEHFVAYSTCSF